MTDRDYLFGPFRLNSSEGLFCGDRSVKLRPKPLLLLLHLVMNAGRTVSQASILQNVWADTYVQAAGLKAYVSVLRRALGDTADDQTYIETVPKRGYRFKAGVRVVVVSGQERVQSEPAVDEQAGTADRSSLSAAPAPRGWLDGRVEVFSSRYAGAVAKAFPVRFDRFPDCLFTDGVFDLAVIGGSSAREDSDETRLFRERELAVEVGGRSVQFSRHVSYDTPRDYVRIADLASFLAFAYARQYSVESLQWPDPRTQSICCMDITATADVLKRNLVLVGGADTNLLIAMATIAFKEQFGISLPVRFAGDDELYFTCDQVYSQLSGRTYSRLEETNYMHCGYVVMCANPWNPQKYLLLAVGTRATGTQAALLSLVRGRDMWFDAQHGRDEWRALAGNNRFDPLIPAKVVRARRARVANGERPIEGAEDVAISGRTRISQRHMIIDFEFLE